MRSTHQSLAGEMTAFLRICLTLSLFLAGVFIAIFSKNPPKPVNQCN